MLRIPQQRLIAELQLLGYRFWEEKPRQKVFREPGGHVVHIRKNSTLSEDAVRSILSQTGRTKEQTDAFIESCRKDEQ
jgi:hypothetical protein